jgi:hypothetical protein
MSILPRWNPYRCMRGQADPSGAPGRALVELYNNSTGADLLLLWNVVIGNGGNPPGARAGIEQGHTATNAETVGSLMSGEAIKPGLLFSATNPAQLTADYMLNDGGGGTYLFGFPVPIAVLQPGFSFFMQVNGSSGNDIPVGFVWQAVHPEDLQGRHCHICDGPTPP